MRILGGAGGVDFLAELDRGCDGTMPGPAHPELLRAVREAHRAGRREEATDRFRRMLRLLLLANRGLDVFVWVQKAILRRRGVLRSERQRSPGFTPDQALRDELDELVAEAGVSTS